jgi:hypothetical protein
MGISQKKENGQNKTKILVQSYSASRPINYKNPPQMKRMDTSYLKVRTTK